MATGARKFVVRVSSPSQCKRVLAIEIPAEEVRREEEAIVRKLRQELKIPGFRKGKVPLGFIRKNYADVIHADAVRNLLPAVYESALIREDLAPVGEPVFANLEAPLGGPITVEVNIEVPPEVKIEGYRKVKVKVKKKQIREKEVDEALAELRERMASFVEVERPARPGDFLVIDFAPRDAQGGTDESRGSKNYPVDLGSGTLLPEFREGLVGMRAGQEKEIHVVYPRDFPEEELAGQEKDFLVKVREVKEKRVPPLDESFVRELGVGLSNLEELRSRVKKDLVEEEEERFRHEVEERIIDEILRKNSFEVPETMVHNYLSGLLEEDRRRRPEVEDEEAREKEIRELFYNSAVRNIRKFFVIEAIKKQESLAATPEEIEQRIERMARESGQEEKVKGYFLHPQRRSRVEREIADEKVLNFLRENAEIVVA